MLEARKLCYPDNTQTTERSSCISLRDFLRHTVERLRSSLTDEKLNEMESSLTLVSKWGLRWVGLLADLEVFYKREATPGLMCMSPLHARIKFVERMLNIPHRPRKGGAAKPHAKQGGKCPVK